MGVDVKDKHDLKIKILSVGPLLPFEDFMSVLLSPR
jgi:5'-3' exonuclease